MKIKTPNNSFLVLLLFLHLWTWAYARVNAQAFTQSSASMLDAFPRIDPDPRALDFSRPANSDYSWIELAEISLWASGDSAVSGLGQVRTIAAAISASLGLPAAARAKAEFILDYMHKNILKSYSINQTRIDIMLSDGRYNCVSSAVLYMILCKSVGLDVTGVLTKDHAFTTVHINAENIDVETTNPYGFDPGNRKEFHDQFGRLTGFAYVPARNYRDRQAISQIELVSLILRNRISLLEAGGRFSEAVPLAVDRAALLNSANKTAYASAFIFEDPYQNLLDRLFNYGTFLLRSGREEDCLLWAAHASAKYPEEKRWQEFIQAAVNNQMTKHLRANRLAEARDFLESQKPVLSPSEYSRFDVLLIDTELTNIANKISSIAEGDSVVAAIQEARADRRINDKRADELLTFAIQKTAALLSAPPGRDWLAAINYIENAVARFGSNRELEQSLRIYRSNRATEFHNRFAAAWNRRNHDEAERILNEGLAEFPNDRQLLADREMMNRNRQ